MSHFCQPPVPPLQCWEGMCGARQKKQNKHVCANIEFGGAGVEADPEKSDITFAEGGATKK